MKTIISVLLASLATMVGAQSSYYATSNVNGGSSSSSSSSYGTSYKNNYYGYSGAYGTNLFAETDSSYYDGYQQSWRYLGWYVKCGYPSDRYDDSGSGSHSNSDEGQRWEGNNYCQRYLIWAAYVDESYQGGGIGEYSYYDPYSGAWDDSACDVHGNGRCAPMDCHLSNTTTWKLMGVFKEASYFGDDAFFEQLFKHEGVCLWNDDDLYEFMSESREEKWTQGCVNTGIQGNGYYFDDSSYGNDNGNYLYLDLKPTWNGNMTYGLYTDSACKYEYEGLDIDPDSVSASMGLLYGSYLEAWNDALEVYKVCQPCKAYNLQQQSSSWQYNSSAGAYQYYKNDDDDDSHDDNDDDSLANDPNEGYFQCDDDAGYSNVNQCMKFRSHAELEVATWEDLVTATNQGGILQVDVGGTIFGSERMSSEQYKYMTRMRRSELAEEAKKYSAMIAEVNALEPEAQEWNGRGRLLMTVGAALFVITLFRWCKRCFCSRREEEVDISKPLLEVPPGDLYETLAREHEERVAASRSYDTATSRSYETQ
ncbi:expressed unknown protein [Seminavis robusta]|uniref:Uncharacterized protein n=1 Tax=Seminavis robusta TaxID=568900 RepID=A0A9N8HJA7_9STRA|nr:expressed unknown protein [Seminavis robusta]|eukprot:Sro753_g197370.1 n/a (536) ;mRNA; r:21730-23410